MKKIMIALTMALLFALIPPKTEAANPTYTVNPNSKTYQGKMMKYTTYNQQTKHYYLLRSYLEQLEKTGGGVLVLEKGTYTISNVLYVPSNVTIRLKNGVVLNKGKATGTKSFGASKSMFQLIRPSRAESKGIVGGYNGEKNITFIGEGTAKINMNYMKDGIAIIAGHNQNVVIDNIEFSNMYSGHFLEVDASKNVTIKNSEFLNSYASEKKIKEAINLDTPDKLTEGWSQIWSKFDKTANDNVLIKDNKFYNLDAAVGTHNYSDGKYHNKVVIQNNVIDKMRTHGIRVMNWSNAIIENNVIKNLPVGNNRGILASGAHNPTFRNNQFENLPRPIEFIVWKNNGKAASYAITYNKLSTTNKKALETNSIKNGGEGYIRYNNIFNDYKNKTEAYPLKVISLSTKPQVQYASKPEAKAYKTTSKTGGYYKIFKAGEKIELYYQGNYWYYGFIKDAKGNTIRVYYHEDEVQGTKPFIPKTLYVSKGGAKAYQEMNKNSKVLATYQIAKALSIEFVGNNWYYGYITYNGKSTKVYFHEDHVQGTKPFNPKTMYVSKGGANAYQEKNKNSKVLVVQPIANTLEIEHLGGDWYYGYVTYNGKSTKAYFHEDNVQGTKPFNPKTMYVSKGGANAYQEMNKNSKVLKKLVIGQIIDLEYVNENWYYGYVKVDGVAIKTYIYKDNVQTEKPFNAKTMYVSKGGASAYKEMDASSDVLLTYNIAEPIEIEHLGGDWYYGYVTYNGQLTKAFFHEDNVQGTKPFNPQTFYVSEGGANSYEEMNKNSKVIRALVKGQEIGLDYVNENWYYGYVKVDGVAIKAYLYKDTVQETKPN